VRRLREHLLATGRFTALGVGTLYAILRGAHLVIRQCRSWFGRFGQKKRIEPEEFQRRRDDVIAAYGPLPEGEVTVCVDVKRVYHRPEPGRCWQHETVPATRPARYHKSDTRTDILGALAPRQAELELECTPKATGASTAQFLARVVKGYVAAGWRRLHLVMDNASTNGAALHEGVMQPWLAYLQVHWTPPHASWLNLAEPFWSSFHRAVLQNSWFKTHDEVVAVTTAYLEYWREHPREYRWPKPKRQRRQPTTRPLWKRLDAIPVYS
jgi:DDE superfamily endonuclease